MATGRKGDELEHQITSAGHSGNSGAREKREIRELGNTQRLQHCGSYNKIQISKFNKKIIYCSVN